MRIGQVGASAIALALCATSATAQAQEANANMVQDQFIWLEDARSDRALDWVRAENDRTNAALTTDPRFETLKAEALAILDS